MLKSLKDSANLLRYGRPAECALRANKGNDMSPFHEHHRGHQHNYKRVALQRLKWSLAITTVVMVVEAVGGWLSGSIALVSDAGHMLTHAFAIAIAAFGIMIARRPACHHTTFGLLRAEVLAAFINGLFLLAICALIVVESIKRFIHPREILAAHMLVIAIVGLVVNGVSILLLQGSRRKDLNIRSVYLHMIGDTASSVGIVIAAVIIYYARWIWLDPALSIGIAMLIAFWALSLLKESGRVLLEMAPKGHNIGEITRAMRKRFPAIMETTNEHVWTITQDVVVFTAHLRIDADKLPIDKRREWLHEVEHWLAEEFKIAESTLQVNP